MVYSYSSHSLYFYIPSLSLPNPPRFQSSPVLFLSRLVAHCDCLLMFCSRTDMECSVGRCPGLEPLELTVSAVAVLSEETMAEETAEEASP